MKWIMLFVVLSPAAYAKQFEVQVQNKFEIKSSFELLGGRVVSETPEKMVLDINNQELYVLRNKFQNLRFRSVQLK